MNDAIQIIEALQTYVAGRVAKARKRAANGNSSAEILVVVERANYLLERSEALKKYLLNGPKVAVHLAGGVIQGVCSNAPVEFFTVEYDEDANEYETVPLEQDDGSFEEALVAGWIVDHEPECFPRIERALDEEEQRENSRHD